jgi:O-antigen/teichoic acid export membrane protein
LIAKLLEAIARRAVSSLVSLGTTSYLAHQLGQRELGTFVGMLALGQLLAVALMLGLDVTPAYLLRNHRAHSRRIWAISTALSVCLAVACVVIGTGAHTLASSLGEPAARFSGWGLTPFAYAGGLLLLLPQLACLQGLLRLRAFNIMQVTYPSIYLVSVVVVDKLLGGLSPQRALYLWALTSVACAALSFALVVRAQLQLRPAPHISISPAPLRSAFLNFSIGSYGANLLGSLNARLPGLLAALVLIPSAAGSFAGLMILNDIFSFFSFAIASITFPLLAGRVDAQQRLRDLAFACRLNTTATLISVVAFLLLFDVFCALLLGKSFARPDFWPMCAAILIFTVLHSTARLLCTDFASQGRPALNAWLNIPAMLVFVLMFWALGERLQAWGALAAFGSASLCFSYLVFMAHRRSSRLRLRDIMLPTVSDVQQLRAAFRSRAD